MRLLKHYLAGLRPDPDYTVSSWADAHRVLTSKSSSEPGPYRTDRIPYVREIMDCLSVGNPAQEIICQKGAQLGLTEVGNNWLCYIIDAVPGPVLAVQPTLDVARRFSKQRLDPMIESCPRVRDKVVEAKSRESGNTLFSKDFPGGMLIITGSNSASGLRSMPIRNLFLDEIDGYVKNVENEGSPIKLAEARTSTFEGRKKIYKISTPTVEGQSAISVEYERSSKERFFVPCVHCKFMQVLEWGQIQYDPKAIRETVAYACIECGGLMREHDKPALFENGEWRAERPEEIYVRGFHISSLYSPVGWLSWAKMAQEYEQARGDANLMRSFVNTKLGLPFREAGETPDFQRIYERREHYRPEVMPAKASLLTCAVDVQRDRLEAMTVAWSRTMERWLVDYQIFQGDIEQEEVWDECEEYLNRQFPIEGLAKTVPISGICIDTGFAQNRVAAFAKRFPRTRMFMIKGKSPAQVFLGTPRQLELRVNGKHVKTGLRIWPVGVDHAKGELYRQLLLPMPEDGNPYPKGYFHFHDRLDLNFFRGLCAEEQQTKVINGFPTYFWTKVFARNEQLDTAVYNRACFAILGCERWSKERWDAINSDLRGSIVDFGAPGEADEDLESEVIEEPAKAVAAPVRRKGRARTKGSYW